MDMLVDARNSLVHAGKQQQPQVGGEGSSPKKAVVYKTDKAIPGLGANQLTEKGRQIGIRAYTDAIQRYALRGLLERLLVTLAKNQSGGGLTINEILGHVGLDGVQGGSSSAEKEATPSQAVVNWPVLPWNEASHSNFEALWKHQHSILLNELPTILRSSNTNSNTSASILSTLLQKCIALEDDHSKRVYQSKSRDDSRGASTVPGYKDAHVAAEKDAVVLASKEEADRVKGKVQLIEKALCGGGSAARSRL